jgi:prolipoprotein diacylglyceryltransferase
VTNNTLQTIHLHPTQLYEAFFDVVFALILTL